MRATLARPSRVQMWMKRPSRAPAIDTARAFCTDVRVMIRPHRYTEPRFTLVEAGDMAGVDYNTLNQWIARGVISVGEVPQGMRRTLYSVADVLAITLLGDLGAIVGMRPGIAREFISKAQLRLAQIARGADDKPFGPRYLVGWQSGPDTFSVSVMIKISGLDWPEFKHPVAVVPIDAIIKRVIERANKEVPERAALDIAEGKRRERV